MKTQNTNSEQADNYNALREFVKTDKLIKEFFEHLSLRKNKEKFTRTTALYNFCEKKGYGIKRPQLAPIWRELEKFGLGKFEQRWKGESRFIWSIDTSEFFIENNIVC